MVISGCIYLSAINLSVLLIFLFFNFHFFLLLFILIFINHFVFHFFLLNILVYYFLTVFSIGFKLCLFPTLGHFLVKSLDFLGTKHIQPHLPLLLVLVSVLILDFLKFLLGSSHLLDLVQVFAFLLQILNFFLLFLLLFFLVVSSYLIFGLILLLTSLLLLGIVLLTLFLHVFLVFSNLHH